MEATTTKETIIENLLRAALLAERSYVISTTTFENVVMELYTTPVGTSVCNHVLNELLDELRNM